MLESADDSTLSGASQWLYLPTPRPGRSASNACSNREKTDHLTKPVAFSRSNIYFFNTEN